MSNIEKTGKRDLAYSDFRRDASGKWFTFTYNDRCYCMDIDWVEWRVNRGIIALMELKEGFSNYPTQFQHERYKEIAVAIKCPYYLIQYKITELQSVECCKECKQKIIVPNNKIITEFKITKGESLIVEGQRGSVNVIDPGIWFTQYPDQHIQWIKNL